MIFKPKKKRTTNRKHPGDRSTNTFSNYLYHSPGTNAEVLTERVLQADQPKNIILNARKTFWQNLPGYIAVLAVLVSFIYAITLNANPKIEIIGNTSQDYIQSIGIYQHTASIDLRQSLMSRTKLTIDTDSLASHLNAQFPELSGVSVVIPLLSHQPIIEIMGTPSVIILSNKQGMYLINQNGVAVVKITSQAQMLEFNLPVLTDETGLSVRSGDTVLTTQTISFINTIIYEFNAKKVPIQSMTLSVIPYELDVQVRGVPYYVKFDLANNALDEAGTYFATVKTLGSTVPSQYIDVRVPGRSYYQ